ncbi:MAG: hypothetical protein RID94_09695, partial [Miltoncostaeaceae bacterium]
AAAAALAALTPGTGTAADAEARRGVLRLLLGDEQPVLTRLGGQGAADLRGALRAGAAIPGAASRADRASAVRTHLDTIARVRPDIASLEDATAAGAALAMPEPALLCAQRGADPAAPWLGLVRGAAPPPAGCTSFAAVATRAPVAGGPIVGLLVDEWTEVVPATTAVTGLAVHADRPDAEAPQSILVAVPPHPGLAWDTGVLAAVLEDTLELAAMRMVDPPALDDLGHHLPALAMVTTAINRKIGLDLGLVLGKGPYP